MGEDVWYIEIYVYINTEFDEKITLLHRWHCKIGWIHLYIVFIETLDEIIF